MPSATLKQTGGEFARFFVVGVGATLLHLAVYLLLNWACNLSEKDALGITLTYSAGYAVSFVANYFVSLRWTFKTEGSVGKGLGFASLRSCLLVFAIVRAPGQQSHGQDNWMGDG